MTYIVGNPPFVGAKYMSVDQRRDAVVVWGGARNTGLLDYVACWYRKGAEMMSRNGSIETALVSTNSITQGEQPGVLWNDLTPRGVRINFAHRTFRWTSEVRGAAAVHCAIIGFALRDRTEKSLFDYDTPVSEPVALRAQRINAYLVDGPLVALPNAGRPLCAVPVLRIGNKPIDGGNYLFTDDERRAFEGEEPRAAGFFRPWIGSNEFINGNRRWCLWLGDASPTDLRAMPRVLARIKAVRRFRLASMNAPTQGLALTPTRFHVETMPRSQYLVIPGVSSERRKYIPLGFEAPDVLSSNLLMVAADATIYHFGILTSLMHLAWVRAVCGRLVSRYRYSIGIVYNNFPWPDPTPARRTTIAARAQAVLDARSAHPAATLADLYDPNTMPPNLARAHAALDRAVDTSYGPPRGGWAREADRVAFLFTRYQALAAPLDVTPARRPRARRPRP